MIMDLPSLMLPVYVSNIASIKFALNKKYADLTFTLATWLISIMRLTGDFVNEECRLNTVRALCRTKSSYASSLSPC